MATTDQRWTAAALAALALSVGIVNSSAPSRSEWLRLPASALQPVVAARPEGRQPEVERLEHAHPDTGNQASLVNALYVLPDGGRPAPSRTHLRM